MPRLDWVRLTDSKGRTYYYNTKNSTSQWEAPPDFREPTPRTIKAVQAKGVIVPDHRQTQTTLKRTLSADHNTIASASSTNNSHLGGGHLLRTVQSLAGFSKSSSKTTQTTSKAQQTNWGEKKITSPTNSSGSTNTGLEDRRYWGRPDRLRTESGDDLLASVAALDPVYRFRTSSSADLIALINLTRGIDGGIKKNQSRDNDNLLKRPPSFMEMDVKSGKIPESLARPVPRRTLKSLSEEEKEINVQKTRPRRNTTNSFTVDNLMSKPDPQVQIRCVASLLHAQMVRFALAQMKSRQPISPKISARFAVFNDDYGKESLTSSTSTSNGQVNQVQSQEDKAAALRRIPSTHTANSLERQVLTRNLSQQMLKRTDSKVDIFDNSNTSPRVPDKEKIAQFVDMIFSKAQMESETIIMLLVYVERLLEATKGKLELTMRNWKPIVLACMVLASKVWDDLSMWNADFSLISGSYTVKRINELEIALLEAMQYNVRVPASTYAKYYFQLRALRASLGEKLPETTEPLSLEMASKFETLSDRYQDALGVGWVGPSAKKVMNKDKQEKPSSSSSSSSKKKKRPQAQGIRLRSNTLYEGANRAVIESMHISGPKFVPDKRSSWVSVEQVVSLKHKGPQTDEF